MVTRLGGEEFGVFLAEPEDHDPETLAEKIRTNIESYDFSKENEAGLSKVTVSIGVHTAIPSLNDTVDSIFNKADDIPFAMGFALQLFMPSLI